MSILSDDNFSMSAEKYLAKHNILTYLEDSLTQLLEHREENPKVVPARFLCEYFCALRDGNHTMFRDFEYAKCTPHNRASFVALFWKCFRQIGKKGDLLSIQEYHSLIGLLCPNFPFQLVQKTARIVLIDDALDCLISFSDFIYAFQVQFYYEEFLEKAGEIYQGLLQTMQSPRDPVIVPTSGENDAKIHQSTHLPADGVDAMQYFRAIYPVLDRVAYSTPPLACLKEILFNVPRISFYGFLMAIAKSDSINAHIGRLPGKAELLEGADIELTSNHYLPRPALKGTGSSQSRPTSSTTRGSQPALAGSASDSNLAQTASASVKTHHKHHHHHHHHQQRSLLKQQRMAARKTQDTESDSDSDSSSDSSDT